MKNRIKILGIIAVILLAAILGVWSRLKKDDAIVLSDSEPKAQDEVVISDSETDEDTIQLIAVHVCGCVNSPGVYTLEEGARITDAIAMAGGFNDEADVNYLNLALALSDGVKVYVPSMSEIEELGGEKSISLYESTGVNQEMGVASGISTVNKSDNGLVNINTASKDELMTLPGVGESKAAAIIKYREDCGGFGTISDIMNISGIKEGLFNKIKDKITV